MNTIPSELLRVEKDTEVVHEVDEGLVEEGAVSETKGGLLGPTADIGTGGRTFS